MLQVFIALILIAFLALFVLLSFPMKFDDQDHRDQSNPQAKTNE